MYFRPLEGSLKDRMHILHIISYDTSSYTVLCAELNKYIHNDIFTVLLLQKLSTVQVRLYIL
jgi:hypothetical protein